MPIMTDDEKRDALEQGFTRLPLLVGIYTGPKELAPRTSYPCPWDMAMVVASPAELEIAVTMLDDAADSDPAHAEQYEMASASVATWIDYRVAKFEGRTPQNLKRDADYIRELQAFDTWLAAEAILAEQGIFRGADQ